MDLENVVVGHNIAKYRKLKEIKAHDIAEQLGMKEATYTKYERGETAITIDFIQKVAAILEANPLHLITASPNNFLESINHSSFTFNGDSTYQTTNEQQTAIMLKLMENIIAVNERMVVLLERKG